MPCVHWCSEAHTPVLLAEVLAALAVKPGGIYVDCTFGRGGHTRKLLECVGPTGRVFALDKDPDAVQVGKELAESDDRFVIERASYATLTDFTRAQCVSGERIFGRVDGVLFDLGVSSPQLADPKRGFGFRVDGPLDMRMDPSTGMRAADWLHVASEGEIVRVLKTYGEERYARRIAKAILSARKDQPIETTSRLADLVARASPSRERNKHVATRTFQAIRIHINQEMEELKDALDQVIDVLASGGRLAVISFHSLEDRLVKRFIRSCSRDVVSVRGLPVTPGIPPLQLLDTYKRPIRPLSEEVAGNPRARSALLRVAQKR
uniref:Ribosomal RNA small subunit methyltransferase H n=1 Tax=Candidatus Kentrum sp. TUN TaxID=2126343 RepID=A0A450ZD28_9GAMM|nr:MAG: 16S rRNA (cytosine1402-N4)-methyltransferase [Candidatus Kentron sp. TUN]VFK52307.1 MAG: 16S rRNA (cytosine1402-N4)-methyltransferase [Candidatus Kentron sp. TUN]VFK52732.1 MAG: 16S rRNA (cytosine1402-N4)-methyltransferase [Candidatus Kentron sp. TUN]